MNIQIDEQVYKQISDQIWYRVRLKVIRQIDEQVYNKIYDQIWDQVQDQVTGIIYEQVRITQ